MNTYTKYYYTYIITNNNPLNNEQFYIGCSSSGVKPEDDVKYMGSSYYLTYDIKQQGIKHFKKEIIAEWSTREEAMLHESRLHRDFDVANDPTYYNKMNSKKGFTVNKLTN